jgi:hypothetical protein
VPAGEIPALIRDGRVDHALAVLCLLWWLHVDEDRNAPDRGGIDRWGLSGIQ